MENSTATAIVPFINYDQTLESDIEVIIKTEKRIKSAVRKLFISDTNQFYDKTSKKWVFGQDGQAFKIGKAFRSAEQLGRKDLLKHLRANIDSRRLSEGNTFHDLVLSGDLETWYNSRPKDKRSKPMTNVGSLLKAFKKETAPVEDTSSPTETPDVGEKGESHYHAPSETVQVTVPQSEQDFVNLMIERGLDLDKVLELILDHQDKYIVTNSKDDEQYSMAS